VPWFEDVERILAAQHLLHEVGHDVINGALPFRYISDAPFAHDVQKRVSATEKAKRLRGDSLAR
jgi:hypothetical protein